MAVFTPRDDRVSLRTAPWGGAGPRPEPLGTAGTVLRRRWWWALAAAVFAAGSLAAVETSAGPATYPLTARFAQAPGLFPGAAVEVLGVPVGTVTSVKNVADEVVVTLAVDRGHPVPATVDASLVSPEILGEPSIDLSPGYTGGPRLASGAVIPLSHTAVPVSTEQVLKALRRTLERINPDAVGNLVSNLARDLRGQGENLRRLIAGAAGTLKLLATKASALGRLNGSLAQLTGALDARTSQITQLISDYDTVSGVIARHGSQLGGALVQLSQASTQLVQLLVPNLGTLESDAGTITTVGRTLDRNLASVDEIFASEVALFTGARRVYTSTYNWLTLNAQLPAGLTGAIIAGMVRSRLEGVCRRILANHATGLSTRQRKTLETCGKPTSTYFDPVTSQIPSILNDIRVGKLPAPGSAASLFGKGLATIPGATSSPAHPTGPAQSPAPRGSSPGDATSTPGPTGSGTPGPGGGTTGASSTTTCLGLLGILKCTSSGSTSASGSTTSNGLLAFDRPSTRRDAPSLTSSAGSQLPPLPAGVPGAPRPARQHHQRARLRAHRARMRAHRARARRRPAGGGGR